ncbi:hypothetical protein BTHERMOSOX_1203 [Bathymodiolus thermophilus thioautotrophic gill symbiont]|uniref:Lcl C-terminal domain-containing protein n=1 Tax=Bathymodiolus thermophilus thioautotrophic gill symbiont TaxID=2360 RepID=UPI0010BBB5A3|nr:DUF1566 domain-containing protein [Bathymodiolus thermophilus thioautotrophic gill symbiont]SHA21832.1 hypothetical protein BTHERMOSOX_1203 [Bathymodiolus thermophilus thioautotrophic gill symbiont]
MKTSIFFTLVFLSGLANAQICNPNIVDNWGNSRYDNNYNGTVVDKQTKLMWKRCAEGLEDIQCSKGSASKVTWRKALRSAKESKFAGYNDWRLPNIKELASLVKRNCHSPSINKRLFPNTPSAFFWSSSPSYLRKHKSLQVRFLSGSEREKKRSFEKSGVRLVRLGQFKP